MLSLPFTDHRPHSGKYNKPIILPNTNRCITFLATGYRCYLYLTTSPLHHIATYCNFFKKSFNSFQYSALFGVLFHKALAPCMPLLPGINCVFVLETAASKKALHRADSLFDEVMNSGLSKPFIDCNTNVSLRFEKYSPGLNTITELTSALLRAILSANDAEYELPNSITGLL